MATAHERYESVKQYRRVYFSGPDGKQIFMDHMTSMGVFATMEDWKMLLETPEASLRLLVEGLMLLKDCGVLVPENFGHLIDKMAELPLPEFGFNEEQNG